MPTVPPACQPIADSVAALEVQEQQLRAGLASLVGPAAWTALAQLGLIRQQLADARAALSECVRQNSAALLATVTVIDVGPAVAAPPARLAGLWELGPAGAHQREAVAVAGDAFAFTGPLPASFGITVGVTGDPVITGPEFRSAALTAAALPSDGPLRIEVVVGPVVRLVQSDLARVAAGFQPTTTHLGGSGVQADVSVAHVDATLTDAGIVARASGQVTVSTLWVPQQNSFAASATLRAVPSAVPGTPEVLDLVTVADVQVQLPGFAGGVADAILPLIRGFITTLLADQVRAVLRAELPAVISRAFVLGALPPDVIVSVRRLSIDAIALQFQPVLGVVGTTLSTFAPPPIAPP